MAAKSGSALLGSATRSCVPSNRADSSFSSSHPSGSGSRGFGAMQIFVYSAEVQGATACNLAQPQAQFELHSQDLFGLTHGQSPCRQSLISMFETGSNRRVFVQRLSPWKGFRGWRTPFRAAAKSVRYRAGMAFAISPERCSESTRNRVRLQPGIAFVIGRIPHDVRPTRRNR